MFTTLLLPLAVVLGGPVAEAAGFKPKTMRDSLSAREVERPLVLGKGWLEVGLGADVKDAQGFWDSEGEAQDFDDAHWLYTTQRMTLRYGLTRRSELFWSVPTHYVSLTNDKLGTATEQFGLGDPSFGYRHELYRTTAPTTSVIGEVTYKAPAGDDSPGNFVGGPNSFSNVVMTSGTPDLSLGLRGKRQVGPFSAELGASFVRRFARAVGYLIETEMHQFQARVKPGDLVKYDLDLMVQVGAAALHTRWMLTQRSQTLLGTASAGLFGDQNLKPVEGSDGSTVDFQFGSVFNLSRGVDVLLDISQPLKGEDLQFFPIEQIHPTRGTTYSAAVELRY